MGEPYKYVTPNNSITIGHKNSLEPMLILIMKMNVWIFDPCYTFSRKLAWSTLLIFLEN